MAPDVAESILCLCPNHHALFDYFATLDPTKLQVNKHVLAQSLIEYHNTRTTKGGFQPAPDDIAVATGTPRHI